MDVPHLLKAARFRAEISQAELARRVGTDRTQISRYESGKVSPTVRTLDRLLEACGLQVPDKLEPWLAHVDERLDALLAGNAQLDTSDLPNLFLTLEDDPSATVSPFYLGSLQPRGACTWAFDGGTALQLHGLPMPDDPICLVAVVDASLKEWLRALGAPIDGPNGWRLDLREASDDDVAAGLAVPFWTIVAFLKIRPVKELPPTVQLSVPWFDRPVPVATVDAVEQGNPRHAEVLARLRARRLARAE